MAAKNTGTENINQLYNHYRAVFPHQIQCPGHVDHPSHARCIPAAVNPQNARSMCAVLCRLCRTKDQELHARGLRFLNGVAFTHRCASFDAIIRSIMLSVQSDIPHRITDTASNHIGVSHGFSQFSSLWIRWLFFSSQ